MIDVEKQIILACTIYHPIPIVFSQAKGSTIWDPEGKKYLDFLSAYSAVNQGHCHPKVLKALVEQAERLTLSSRAFYNDRFPIFAERLKNMFGYDMVLPMNTGAEGVETALKLARKWGYEKKKIPKDQSIDHGFREVGSGNEALAPVRQATRCFYPGVINELEDMPALVVKLYFRNKLASKAIIVSCCGCFHGRTLAVISMSCDNEATRGFGPLLPGHLKVDFGDEVALEKIFEENGDRIAGFLFEPIQGEAGVIIPPDGYLKAVRELCSKFNILMIADEIQSGLGRSGRMLACDWAEVRPDVVADLEKNGKTIVVAIHLILGKALGGGVIAVSAVLADKDVMLSIQPGEHGSTFGGNPLASAVAVASLDVITEEGLSERQEICYLMLNYWDQKHTA
ncbi:Ornithine aminotransferase, mitochondrial [Vitis vinifera]|uniref:Ornithine aminotransferase n=1 Tax=Vitis vinifera TaxID=29760 RepID=A0A438HZR9_VITVI|nr:Ornithine aminotransferase, mitochondrial [Vitis vinifera]